ncbi:putativedimethylguanosine trna methyltransferase [Phaeomoniella chlamydospora]|uniref:tRNA (guanine(26)-N(2))-dimethyltransferase n=1 Tax=Phaeomoniella chlamydospora TaxID=158046 RepID=A0A0G2G7V6_PHACM|nr:putativedimethylguanosine trna methyltransferase [Phaeomoniella chlamydospora]
MADVGTNEAVEFQGKKYIAIREGKAKILTPYRDHSTDRPTHKTSKNNNNNTGVQTVFYNKIQQFNRDLTILAILVHGEGVLVEKRARIQRKAKTPRKQRAVREAKHASADASTDKARDDSGVALKIKDDPGNSRKRKLEAVHEGEQGHIENCEQGAAKKARNRDRPDIAALEGDNPDPTESGVHNEAETSLDDAKVGNSDQKQEKIRYTILDALSATGLRSLRYAKEIPFATRIVANDLLPEAVKAIETNIKYNQVDHVVTPHLDDARVFMYSKVGNETNTRDETYVHRFDVIDLDPYGTAAPFFDASLQALQDGGLLCVTCTDAGVFASNGYPEKAYSLYAGTTMKGVHSHEAGLRLILHAISLSAAKYGIAIEPLLSLSIDFYARLFIRVHRRPREVKLLSGTSMIAYNCDSGCSAWTTQSIGRSVARKAKNGEQFFHHGYAQGPSAMPNCDHCGFKTHMAGPMWAGPLHNPFFIRGILAKLPSLDRSVYGTFDRIEGMLKTAIEEDMSSTIKPTSDNGSTQVSRDAKPSSVIPRTPPELVDPMPFFFIPTFLAKVLHTITPSEARLRAALISLGYKVTRSHCKAGSFKTNAPWSVIWEIFREWVRKESPVKEGVLREGTPGYEIMKRVRTSESAKVLSYRDELIRRLGKTSSLEGLKSEMEAGMFRLEQLQSTVPDVDPSNKQTPNHTNGPHSNTTTTPSLPSKEDEKSPSNLNIVFDEKIGKEVNKEKLVRYQINLPHWGPMNRATGRSD